MADEKGGMTVKKAISLMLCGAAMLLLLVSPARADGPTPADDDPAAHRVVIGSDTEFDTDERMFVYRVESSEVKTSFPSGFVSADPVSVVMPNGLVWRLYRDGVEQTDVNLSKIAESGKYVLLFGDLEQRSVKFTLVNDLTGMLTEYVLPEGFSLDSVTLDGEEQLLPSSYVADLSREGRYVVRYGSSKAGVSFQFSVTTDHTPPVLKLEAVENGYASGPVDISDRNSEDEITILLNEKPIDYEKELTKSGSYRITLRDPAGNVTEYSFVIGVYFNFNSFAFVFILVLALAALVVYLVRSRRKLRIR